LRVGDVVLAKKDGCMKKSHAPNKLRVAGETVRRLTSAQLAHAVGGDGTTYSITETKAGVSEDSTHAPCVIGLETNDTAVLTKHP
jgi:hypothetical protein